MLLPLLQSLQLVVVQRRRHMLHLKLLWLLERRLMKLLRSRVRLQELL